MPQIKVIPGESDKILLIPTAVYTNKEIRIILGVDERLIRKYRDNGHLAYSRVHDKYWYRGTDIINFLDRTYSQGDGKGKKDPRTRQNSKRRLIDNSIQPSL